MNNLIIPNIIKPFEFFIMLKDFSNYKISNLGNVLNITTGKIMNQFKCNNGYMKIKLKNEYGERKNNLIHRLVLTSFVNNPDNKPCVDHIDNNKTNNKLENLRFATNQENNRNKKIAKNNTTGVKGVTTNKSTGKYIAHIKTNSKLIHIGTFKTLEEARDARKEYANINFGDFARSSEKQ